MGPALYNRIKYRILSVNTALLWTFDKALGKIAHNLLIDEAWGFFRPLQEPACTRGRYLHGRTEPFGHPKRHQTHNPN